MITTSKYFILTPTGDNQNLIDFELSYGNITTVGRTIQYSGSSRVDSIFVRPGLAYDLGTTGAGADKIYLTGSLSNYTLSVDAANQTLTLARTVNGQSESVLVSGGTNLASDKLVFANGTVSANTLFLATNTAGRSAAHS